MSRFNFFIAIVCIFIASCKKQPAACIDGPLTVNEGESPTYNWCGEYEEEVEWRFNGNTVSSGSSFTPDFTMRGLNTLEATGKNGKKHESKVIEINYGKTSKTYVSFTNLCNSTNKNIPNTSDIQYFHAYLYNSRYDWVEDAKQGTHWLAIDSTSCQFLPGANTAGALFSKTYTRGSQKIVSVEFRNGPSLTPYLSNWADLMYGQTGTVDINNYEFTDNGAQTRLDTYSKQFVTGKWVLTTRFFNTTSIQLADCESDDYLKFFADGTWTYNSGPKACGSSQSSNSVINAGTFYSLPTCITPVTITMQGNITQNCVFKKNTIEVSSNNSNYVEIYNYQQ
jgi:hypothetical protein